jgi:hypothetical protein
MREWVSYLGKYIGGRVRVMVFIFTFNNISVIVHLALIEIRTHNISGDRH